MIYYICFWVSTFFIWIGTRKCNRICMERGTWEEVKLRKIPVFVGILFPVLVAAFRATTIGVDVELYVVPYFERAYVANNFQSYLISIGNGRDIGYYLLNFIISRFTDDVRVLFFFIELIILCFVFAGCWNLRGRSFPWLSMLFYYFIFYNMTLSTVRQSIACAISFFAISISIRYSAKKGKMLITLLTLLIAMAFHTTAIVVFLILFVYHLIGNMKVSAFKFSLISIFGCVVIRLFLNQFLDIVGVIALVVNDKYTKEFFLNSNNVGAGGYKSIILLAVIVLTVQILLLRREKNEYWIRINGTLAALNVIYIAGMLLLTKLMFIPRMLYYIQMFWNVSLAQTEKAFPVKKQYKKIIVVMIILIVNIYWLFFYIIGRVHGTYPYVTM